jgi:uncharacterized membrane protein
MRQGIVLLAALPLLAVQGLSTRGEFAVVAHAQESKIYVVDGLALGGAVRVERKTYKDYDCRPSTQYRGLTFCQRRKTDKGDRGRVSATTTILHADDGVTTYVNGFIEPAFFAAGDVEKEIARLSAKFGQRAQVMEAPKRSGVPDARLAVWGTLRLTPLDSNAMVMVRSGQSPGKGMLADYLGDFSRSAQVDLPVFAIEGQSGFVWIASFDENGRGKLRFFAINAARLSALRKDDEEDLQRKRLAEQRATAARAEEELKNRIISDLKKVEQEAIEYMENCEPTCPDNPEAEEVRLQAANNLEQEKLAADEAERFAAAIGNELALSTYISSCKKCEFRSEAQAALSAIREENENNKMIADAEMSQFQASHGDIPALKRYLADCQLCTFASLAVRKIQEAASKYEELLFSFELCNNDHLEVHVAIAGREDPHADMWTSRGWWKVGSGQCRTIGTYAKGYFYYFAENRRASWSGGKNFCTSSEAFRILIMPDECAEGESTKGFHEINIQDSNTQQLLMRNLGASPP